MKKRLLLILAVGIAFSPSVFADGVGPFSKSNDAGVAGASFCHAGMTLKQVAAEEQKRADADSKDTVAAQAAAGT